MNNIKMVMLTIVGPPVTATVGERVGAREGI
jgi:hypothetical protein